MTLRAQIAADLPTFLNVDEFGESVDIDGTAVLCVVEGNGDTEGNSEGIIDRDTLIYARASSFYQVPVVGQRIEIDGERADVIAVAEDQGMLEIRVRWLDS